jgi:hypothetical protein
VSQKEIDRNNAIYQIQNNRNPFIDNPEFAQRIYDPTASLAETQLLNQLHVYPNPAAVSGQVNLQWQSNATVDEFVVTDVRGRVVMQKSISTVEQEYQLNLDELERGFYLIQLYHNSKAVAVSKLLLN